MNKFSSLCVLAYKRPDKLIECLDSLHKTIDRPCEIIVNLDATDAQIEEILLKRYRDQGISKLILSNGKNRGVGRSFQNCLGVAEGDYIFKLDSDLIFKKGWLSTSIKILERSIIGAVGLFDYNIQDPNDERFKPEVNIIEKLDDCYIVKDFVSSGYGFRKTDYFRNHKIDSDIPDDGLHQSFGRMALPKESIVDNKSFGFDSVYIQIKPDGSATKTVTFSEPLLFQKTSQSL